MSTFGRFHLVLAVSLMALCGCRSADSTAKLVSADAAQVANTSEIILEKYRTAADIKAEDEMEKEQGIVFPKLVRGNPGRREVALTFDDGPHPDYTPKLLDILAKEKVPATFFVIGKMVDKHPELVQREVAEGHQAANHTYDHIRLVGLPQTEVESELRRGSEAIARAIGEPTRYYRPPGGEYDASVVAASKSTNCTMILWTDDPGDYANPGAEKIEDRTLHDARNGGILLLHDGAVETLTVLPQVIHKLKSEGYTFVTVADMARQKGDITVGGPQVLRKKQVTAPGRATQ